MDLFVAKQSESIYQVIYNNLLDQILNESYRIGDYLPSESELEKIFKASRTPIRKALNQLETDGYIIRIKGKGSVVESKYPTGRWTLMTGFQHNYIGNHGDEKRIKAETIKVSKIYNEELAAELNVFLNNEITYVERVRYFNDNPIIYLQHYIHPEVPIEFFDDNLFSISIGDILKNKAGVDIKKATEQIEAVLADKIISSYLNVEESTPLLKIKRISYTEQDKPIDINIYYVRTDSWKYFVNYNF